MHDDNNQEAEAFNSNSSKDNPIKSYHILDEALSCPSLPDTEDSQEVKNISYTKYISVYDEFELNQRLKSYCAPYSGMQKSETAKVNQLIVKPARTDTKVNTPQTLSSKDKTNNESGGRNLFREPARQKTIFEKEINGTKLLLYLLFFVFCIAVPLFSTSKEDAAPTQTAYSIEERHSQSAFVPVVVPNINAATHTATVIGIVDGDTIDVKIDEYVERVRFIGIDTPESVHPDTTRNVPMGSIVSDFTYHYLNGKTVKLEFDAEERDGYGRLLAYVYISEVDGTSTTLDFGSLLLSNGYAAVTTYPPNDKYADWYIQQQNDAIDKNLGIWAS